MSNTSTTARVLYRDTFDGNGFTNENSLANALLTKPDQITPVLTHLAGREDKKFPLTFLTEGQRGGTRLVELNDVQYEWSTINKMKHSDRIVSSAYTASTDRAGINNSPIYVTFETNWLKTQHTVHTPNGYAVRIAGKPTRVGAHFLYEFRLITTDPAAYIPHTEFTAGLAWAMVGGANVSESFSMGNESNVMMPGKMKNQVGVIRKSYHWGGNIGNKTVEILLQDKNGNKTNYWLPFEEWQHILNYKQACEENYWYSRYNRDAQGQISLMDEDSGLPIPMSAGVEDQIPNMDTYSTLTYKKIKNTVGDVMYGATDTGKMEVVLYTGLGGLEEFSEAMQDKALGYTQIVGDKFVKGEGRNLMLTGFFTSFQHIDGHVVTVAHLPLLDFGSKAEIAPKHPVSGRPITSYDMYFIDQSMYDGEPNVLMVTQKGRSMIRRMVAGMTPIKYGDFSGNSEYIASEQDKSSVHLMSAKGICIRRNNHCFKLSCNLGQ